MYVVEWTITNFSYWNEYVHEKLLECSGSGFSNCPRILLYPRGLNGCGKHLVVRIYVHKVSSVLSGHLYCTDSNGSLYCSLEVNDKVRKGDCYELRPMLEFTEVAALLRKYKVSHHDEFTLRYELRSDCDRAYRLYTTIDVFDSTVKIDPTVIKEEEHYISTIKYPYDGCEKESNMTLWVNVNREKTIFYMEPISLEKNILVSTSLSVLKFDSVTRTVENEHVFLDDERWPFVDSLTMEELTEKGFSLLLRIKIAPHNKYKHHCSYYTGCGIAVDLLPTNIPTLSSGGFNAASIKAENSVTVLLNELKCLYKDQNFSDFELRCGGVSFPTHKGILSARSPVLKANLLIDMAEDPCDYMDITDLDVDTLEHFLAFLYTGIVDDLEWEVALKLYYAADKYQVPSLKSECFSQLVKNVSVSNVCDILSLADKHRDGELTAEAHDFILENYNEVLRSEGWKTLMSNEPVLGVKTLTYFAEINEFKVIPDS